MCIILIRSSWNMWGHPRERSILELINQKVMRAQEWNLTSILLIPTTFKDKTFLKIMRWHLVSWPPQPIPSHPRVSSQKLYMVQQKITQIKIAETVIIWNLIWTPNGNKTTQLINSNGSEVMLSSYTMMMMMKKRRILSPRQQSETLTWAKRDARLLGRSLTITTTSMSFVS